MTSRAQAPHARRVRPDACSGWVQADASVYRDEALREVSPIERIASLSGSRSPGGPPRDMWRTGTWPRDARLPQGGEDILTCAFPGGQMVSLPAPDRACLDLPRTSSVYRQ